MTITTKFLDVHWIEDDGPKADVADIILRHMTNPKSYVKNEPKKIDTPKYDYYGDAPFWDADELADPLLHEWRQKLRDSHIPKLATVGNDEVTDRDRELIEKLNLEISNEE